MVKSIFFGAFSMVKPSMCSWWKPKPRFFSLSPSLSGEQNFRRTRMTSSWSTTAMSWPHLPVLATPASVACLGPSRSMGWIRRITFAMWPSGIIKGGNAKPSINGWLVVTGCHFLDFPIHIGFMMFMSSSQLTNIFQRGGPGPPTINGISSSEHQL